MSLTKQKDSLMRDRDRLTAEVDDLNKKLQQQRVQTEAVEKKRAEFEEKCRELYKSLDVSMQTERKIHTKVKTTKWIGNSKQVSAKRK